jgi:adenylate cyclase 9
VLFLTTVKLYRHHCFKVSLLLAAMLCSMSLLATANVSPPPRHDPQLQQQSGALLQQQQNDLSPAGLYAIYLAITLLLYTAVPLPLYGTLLVGVTYSTLFEVLLCLALPERRASEATVAVNVLLHVCIHVIGVHTLITTQVGSNNGGTFGNI